MNTRQSKIKKFLHELLGLIVTYETELKEIKEYIHHNAKLKRFKQTSPIGTKGSQHYIIRKYFDRLLSSFLFKETGRMPHRNTITRWITVFLGHGLLSPNPTSDIAKSGVTHITPDTCYFIEIEKIKHYIENQNGAYVPPSQTTLT